MLDPLKLEVKGGCELISMGVASQASVLNCRATSPDLIYVFFFPQLAEQPT